MDGSTARSIIDRIRETRPATANHLHQWIWHFTGVKVNRHPVCRDHRPPLDWLARQWLDRPNLVLILGARGSGKSFLQAVLTHLESRFHPGLGTRILGGSKAQSAQIYEALTRAVRDGRGDLGGDFAALRQLLKTEATYHNGSRVSILAASPHSVRGPHVPSLRLDEVDEIDPEIREAAVGMAMAIGGVPASVSMTSTWHKIAGPMAGLLERAKNGEFPHYTTCAFDVLERCPESRSGSFVGGEACYAKCPECPIRPACHAERDRNGDRPLAKLSDGHYAIDSLIQKVQGTSPRTFASDYLCQGPRAEGLWFTGFDLLKHVTTEAEYDPNLPVHLAIDSGVHTGAAAFQVRESLAGPSVTVFWDFLSYGLSAEVNARLILERLANRRGTRLRISTDPAGNARNPIGPTVIAEYERAGLRPLERWPNRPKADALALVEAFLLAADGTVSLTIHPRCQDLITAFQNYRRAKHGGAWQDRPEDPLHPHEDVIDALVGGHSLQFPEGRRPPPKFSPKPVGQVMY